MAVSPRATARSSAQNETNKHKYLCTHTHNTQKTHIFKQRNEHTEAEVAVSPRATARSAAQKEAPAQT